jgi:hypothetical protein
MSELPPVTTFRNLPKVSVPSGGAAPARIADSSVRVERAVLIQASPANADGSLVSIFDSADTQDDGYLLGPGDSVPWPVRDPRDIFCHGSEAGLELRVVAF